MRTETVPNLAVVKFGDMGAISVETKAKSPVSMVEVNVSPLVAFLMILFDGSSVMALWAGAHARERRKSLNAFIGTLILD